MTQDTSSPTPPTVPPNDASVEVSNPPVDDKNQTPSKSDRNSTRRTDLKSSNDDSNKISRNSDQDIADPPDPTTLISASTSPSGPAAAAKTADEDIPGTNKDKSADLINPDDIGIAKSKDTKNVDATKGTPTSAVRDDFTYTPDDRKSPSISSTKGSRVLEVSYAVGEFSSVGSKGIEDPNSGPVLWKIPYVAPQGNAHSKHDDTTEVTGSSRGISHGPQ